MTMDKKPKNSVKYNLDFPQDDWEAAKSLEQGTIVTDWPEDGMRIIIMRSRIHFCCYIGIPKDHPLAGHDYDLLPIQCHWGLTFGQEGDGEYYPAGYYWYGWDYAHFDDAPLYSPRVEEIIGTSYSATDGKKWTPKLIKEDAEDAIYDFKRLMKLAEEIHNGK